MEKKLKKWRECQGRKDTLKHNNDINGLTIFTNIHYKNILACYSQLYLWEWRELFEQIRVKDEKRRRRRIFN